MKLLSYLFNNTVTIWEFFRKWFLRCAGLLLLWCIGLYTWASLYLSPASIQWFLISDYIKEWLESTLFLHSGEYIDIQENTIVSNKVGSWFSWDSTITYQNLESCEQVFNDNTYSDNAVVIIPSWVCIVDSNKQQVITVKQLREARASVLTELWSGLNTGYMVNYPFIASLFTGEIVHIDSALLSQIVKVEIPTLFADKEFLLWIDSIMRLFSWWMMILLYIIWLFLIVWMLLAFLVVRVLYSIVTRLIAKKLKKPITNFTKACSVTWLPLLLLSLVLDTMISLPRWWDLFIFSATMAILMIIYYGDTKDSMSP